MLDNRIIFKIKMFPKLDKNGTLHRNFSTMLVLLVIIVQNVDALLITQSADRNDFLKTNFIGSQKCSEVPADRCPELKYNYTINGQDNSNIHEGMDINKTNEMFDKLSPVFKAASNNRCVRQMRFLICSTVFPFCSDDISQPVLACRNVCEQVKADCSNDPIVKQFWPEFLDCEQLPQNEKRDLCLTMPNILDESELSLAESASTEHPDSQFKIHQLSQSTIWKIIHPRGHVSTLTTCPKNFTLNERGNCVYKCGTDAFFTSHQKKVVETCILVFSVLCFIFTLFSLITFWTESTRFKFPERPVLFLTLCYNLLSICFLVKIFYQKSTNIPSYAEVKTELTETTRTEIESTHCVVNSQCLAYFIIINYLILSASFWWLIFGLSWWLSTAKQWSPEALERKSGLFHVFAWLLPLASPIVALLFGAIKKTELTGMCTSVGFTEIPSFVLLVIGMIFVILSARSLRSLKASWKNEKLSQVMSRILLFSLIYVIPAISAIVFMFLDYEREIPPCLPGETCYLPEKRSVKVTIAGYACLMMGGISGIWVWSKKTCMSCRKKISTSQYSIPSPQTTIENDNKHNSFNYVHSLQKSLLKKNYISHSQKKIISDVHQQNRSHSDWMSAHNRI